MSYVMTPEQKAFEATWFQKKVRLRDESDYEMPRTEYLVTAALFHWEGDGQTIFAILSNEYSLPEKPWFFTMKFTKDYDLDAHLNKHFYFV